LLEEMMIASGIAVGASGILTADFGELVDLVVVRVINRDKDLLVPTIAPLFWSSSPAADAQRIGRGQRRWDI
jgi:hypothetical protein